MTDDIKLRDMPEPLWAWLKERARLHGRTIDQEVAAVLDSVRLGKARVARGDLTLDELLAFGRKGAALPTLSDASEEEILGIDPRTGAPA
ncbi:MAG: hypothetical protein ACLGHB_07500 [Gammaproteobacteria bacterium]|jgi:plasmid stability protein